MADKKQFGKGALLIAMVGAGVAGVWFGRCTRNTPAEASHAPTASTSAWAPATSADSPRPSASLEKPGPIHFDLTENPQLKIGIQLRDLDRDIFARLNDLDHMSREQMADVFPDKPYRVRFIGNLADKHIGIVLIDLNRDGTTDEKWQLMDDGSVKRTVPMDHNANDTEVRYQLGNGRWQVR